MVIDLADIDTDDVELPEGEEAPDEWTRIVDPIARQQILHSARRLMEVNERVRKQSARLRNKMVLALAAGESVRGMAVEMTKLTGTEVTADDVRDFINQSLVEDDEDEVTV